MPLDGLIFDVDGTLVDTNALHARAWVRAFARFGRSFSEERILPEIGKGGDRLVPAVAGEEVEDRHGKALRDAHGEAFRELLETEEVRVFPNVSDLLEAVRHKGLRTAAATASKKDDLKNMLGRAGLDLPALVDVVVTDSDVDRSKPAPDTVQAAFRKLELPPERCAMVGDTPYDAEASRRAGVVCLGMCTGVYDAEALRAAGARAAYRDPAALLGNLDEALHLAARVSE